MDDQFNGRTDDDLFADDYEPVDTDVTHEETTEVINDSAPAAESTPPTSSAQETETPQLAPTTAAPRSLGQSRHAKPTHQPRPRKHSPKPKPAAAAAAASEPEDANPPAAVSPAKPGSNTALADRLASGANPRTKLTDTELADKMEKMRILAAEKTRKFEQAERDSRSHALAYERGMEEARRRRAEEAEHRRRGEEERRRMDAERAANRERKLRAMGAKESSWDEGKSLEDERERRAGFRGANGGVRGARSGMAGSRFAERDEGPIREFGPDDFRGSGRGRGRGGSRGGRGGRGAFRNGERVDRPAAHNGASPQKEAQAQAPPTIDDFPALPSAKKLNTTDNTGEAAKAFAVSPDATTPIGKWDDEMAALDAKAT
ncbi:hypothetical protein F4779DRAFT_309814 [Xylariaceae sp. FL0662B]|nr:hypothetical protein F4779DRAFT_309814 [Xylariaceae sp. FL0662B]